MKAILPRTAARAMTTGPGPGLAGARDVAGAFDAVVGVGTVAVSFFEGTEAVGLADVFETMAWEFDAALICVPDIEFLVED